MLPAVPLQGRQQQAAAAEILSEKLLHMCARCSSRATMHLIKA